MVSVVVVVEPTVVESIVVNLAWFDGLLWLHMKMRLFAIVVVDWTVATLYFDFVKV